MGVSREEALKILGLPFDASEYDIKASYRRLALQYHPDKCDPEDRDGATKRFQEISLAYKKLTSTDDEVDRLRHQFMNPEFIWILINAMRARDFRTFYSASSDEEDCYQDEDSSDECDDEDGYHSCDYCGYGEPFINRRCPRCGSLFVRRVNLTPEEAERRAKELVAQEEREKQRVKRKQEKRRKKRQRRGKKRQEQQSTAAAEAATAAASAKQRDEEIALKMKQQQQQQRSTVESQGRNAGNGQVVKDAVHNDSSDTDSDSDSGKSLVEEEDFDENCAFVTRGAAAAKNQKRQQQQPTVPTQQNQPQKQPLQQQQQQPTVPTQQNQPQKQPLQQQQQHPSQPRQQPPPPPLIRPQPQSTPTPLQSLMSLNLPAQSHSVPDIITDPVQEARRRAKEGNRLMSPPLEDYSAAAEEFTAAIRLDPTDCRYYGSRAVCQYRMGLLRPCLADAEQSVQLSPQYAKGFYARGLAQAGLGLHAEAAASFASVAALDAAGCGDALDRMRDAQIASLAEGLGCDRGLCERALDLAGGDVDAAANRILAGGAVGLDRIGAGGEPKAKPRPSWADSVASGPSGVPRTRNLPQQQQQQRASSDETANTDRSCGNSFNSDMSSAKESPASDNPYNVRSLWVGSVKADVTEAQLRKAFGAHGRIQSVRLVSHSCYAFVNMASAKEASAARAALDGQVLGSHRIVVRFQSG